MSRAVIFVVVPLSSFIDTSLFIIYLHLVYRRALGLQPWFPTLHILGLHPFGSSFAQLQLGQIPHDGSMGTFSHPHGRLPAKALLSRQFHNRERGGGGGGR
jgi:hypothetical protein